MFALFTRRLLSEVYVVEHRTSVLRPGITRSEMEEIVRTFCANRKTKALEERKIAAIVSTSAALVDPNSLDIGSSVQGNNGGGRSGGTGQEQQSQQRFGGVGQQPQRKQQYGGTGQQPQRQQPYWGDGHQPQQYEPQRQYRVGGQQQQYRGGNQRYQKQPRPQQPQQQGGLVRWVTPDAGGTSRSLLRHQERRRHECTSLNGMVPSGIRPRYAELQTFLGLNAVIVERTVTWASNVALARPPVYTPTPSLVGAFGVPEQGALLQEQGGLVMHGNGGKASGGGGEGEGRTALGRGR